MVRVRSQEARRLVAHALGQIRERCRGSCAPRCSTSTGWCRPPEQHLRSFERRHRISARLRV